MISFTHAEIEKIVKEAHSDTQKAVIDSLGEYNDAASKATQEIACVALKTMEKLILLDIANDITQALKIAYGNQSHT